MAVVLDELRLSLVWVGTVLVANTSKARFVTRADYEALFDSLQKAPADEFELPWSAARPYENLYWRRYLAVANPASVHGSNGWRRAVPLRSRRHPVTLAAAGFPGIVRAEQYLYPFGLALVVTFYGRAALPAEEWIDHAAGALGTPRAAAVGDAKLGDLPLTAVANEWLQRMSEAHFGSAASLLATSGPYSILTVIRGSGVDETVEPKDGDATHRLLFGASSLDTNWKTASLNPAPLATSKRRRKGGSPGDAIFAVKRGRAVWTPSSFTKAAPMPSQSCYHRNQLLAAMQVESLCNLAGALAGRLGKDGTLPPRLADFERVACRQLADIDAGDGGTYRSIGLRHQIAARGDRESIETLCTRQGIAFH